MNISMSPLSQSSPLATLGICPRPPQSKNVKHMQTCENTKKKSKRNKKKTQIMRKSPNIDVYFLCGICVFGGLILTRGRGVGVRDFSKIIELAENSSKAHQNIIQAWQKEGEQDEKINAEWSKVIWTSWSSTHKDFTYPLMQAAIDSPIKDNQWLAFFLTFGLAIIGGLLYIVPDFILMGPAGIKNNALFQHCVMYSIHCFNVHSV